jgi:hypothetical protein
LVVQDDDDPRGLRFLDDGVQGGRGVRVDQEQVHLARDQVPDLGDLSVHVRAGVLHDELAHPALFPVDLELVPEALRHLHPPAVGERTVAQADHEAFLGAVGLPAGERRQRERQAEKNHQRAPGPTLRSQHFSSSLILLLVNDLQPDATQYSPSPPFCTGVLRSKKNKN